MSNTVVVLSEEFMKRIKTALGEIQMKVALPVLAELETWEKKFVEAPHEVLTIVENHIAPAKAKIAAAEAKIAADKAAVDAAAVAALKKVEAAL
jgi:hypothetical protein